MSACWPPSSPSLLPISRHASSSPPIAPPRQHSSQSPLPHQKHCSLSVWTLFRISCRTGQEGGGAAGDPHPRVVGETRNSYSRNRVLGTAPPPSGIHASEATLPCHTRVCLYTIFSPTLLSLWDSPERSISWTELLCLGQNYFIFHFFWDKIIFTVFLLFSRSYKTKNSVSNIS